MKALVYVVLEYQAFEKGERRECVMTEEVTKHLGLSHADGMKVIAKLREQAYLGLRERKSRGISGNGYDGSLFAELKPKEQGILRVRKYLRVGR
jgi:hypothetical protein